MTLPVLHEGVRSEQITPKLQLPGIDFYEQRTPLGGDCLIDVLDETVSLKRETSGEPGPSQGEFRLPAAADCLVWGEKDTIIMNDLSRRHTGTMWRTRRGRKF